VMRRTTSQIFDVHEANLWVMDPEMQYVDEPYPLDDTRLHRVRGVEGVEWAVRLYKGLVRARMDDGRFRQVMLLGLDDTTLVGAPVELVQGNLADLRRPDAVILDEAGYKYMWPDEPYRLGRLLEMNDHRAVLVGICKASAPFQSMPVMYTRYDQAV